MRSGLFGLLCATLLASCGAAPPAASGGPPTVTCRVGEQTEQRPLRACDAPDAAGAELTRLQSRIAAIALAPAEASATRDALTLLSTEHDRVCEDWNTCALDVETYRVRSDAIAAHHAHALALVGRAETEGTADDLAALAGWARAVLAHGAFSDPAEDLSAERDAEAQARLAAAAERQTELTARAVEQQQATAQSAVEQQQRMQAAANQAVLSQAAVLERQAAEYEAFAALVVSARQQSLEADRALPTPPMCVDRQILEQIRLTGTSGNAASGLASSLVHSLDQHCARFDRWTHPTEALQRQIDGFFQLLDRIVEWMSDIRGCGAATGRAAARCTNAYDHVGTPEAEEAVRVLALVDALQRELANARSGLERFPCRTPVLEQIDASPPWVGTTARAQIPGLPRRAESVCDAIGVGPTALREGNRDLARDLDRSESSARSTRRQLLETAATLRAQAGGATP